MANTSSAKKAIRSSERKKVHNLFWKNKISDSVKNLKKAIKTKDTKEENLRIQLTGLQKILDKSSKEKVIHKNKANRIKSKYARKITALFGKADQKASSSAKTKSK